MIDNKELEGRAISKSEEDFEKIRDALRQFNNEDPVEGSKAPNPSRKRIRIDYESIYAIKDQIVVDYDVFGNRISRPANDAERKDELAKQAKEAFGITLNKSMTFMNMIARLTEEVGKLNEELENEDGGDKVGLNNDDPLSKQFSVNDLLYTFETVLGVNGTKSNIKPNVESVKLLESATINIDRPKNRRGFGKVSPLTRDEVDMIVDPDFIMGC